MPWATPTLSQVRRIVRDNVTAMVAGAAMVPNNVLRVMADAMAGLASLTLEYIDWLAKQLLPDTSETEWLDRHGQIWLTNSDGTKGRKQATLPMGAVLVTGTNGTPIPVGSTLISIGGIPFQTLQEGTISGGQTPFIVQAMTGGVDSNVDAGMLMNWAPALPGVDLQVTVDDHAITGGLDKETDDDLRARVLFRIQQPPMGGDKDDYELWALSIPGVTRAWAAPLEMGMGTVTLRFMMDTLRATNDGFPLQQDI